MALDVQLLLQRALKVSLCNTVSMHCGERPFSHWFPSRQDCCAVNYLESICDILFHSGTDKLNQVSLTLFYHGSGLLYHWGKKENYSRVISFKLKVSATISSVAMTTKTPIPGTIYSFNFLLLLFSFLLERVGFDLFYLAQWSISSLNPSELETQIHPPFVLPLPKPTKFWPPSPSTIKTLSVGLLWWSRVKTVLLLQGPLVQFVVRRQINKNS